ncbi:excisionase family DNA binding protein [Agathobaculum butyriciproducens]|uniref:helix-turn-helix domain-containing protein n=1 Tax=Agathobaculum butyriciproducens TaxID=1628085 RepID=UPI000D5D3DE6|nr:excisionase family DNA binding protein [Agathobaculum butyriciproducens]
MSTSQEKKLPSNRTYTVDDIAAILGIAKSTAYRLVNSGEFKTIRIGYAIRIPGSRLRTGWLWRI